MNDKLAHNGDGHAADIRPEQLTAFALGQLAGDEQAAIERWLAEPEQTQARQAVAEMRRLAEVLPGALSVGGSLKPSTGLREAVLQKLAEAEKVEPASKAILSASRWPRAIQWAIVGGIACLVVGLAIPAIRTAREAARRASPGNSLRQSPQHQSGLQRLLLTENPNEGDRSTVSFEVEPVTGPIASSPQSADRNDPLAPQIELPPGVTGSVEASLQGRSVGASVGAGGAGGAAESHTFTLPQAQHGSGSMMAGGPAHGYADSLHAGASTQSGNINELRSRIAATELQSAASEASPTANPASNGEQKFYDGGIAAAKRPNATVAELDKIQQLHAPNVTLHNGQTPDAGIQLFSRSTEGFAREQYEPIVENSFLAPSQHPLSTFSIDVDTASYSNVRRFLTGGQLPPPSAVRIEELVNYFSYSDPQPQGREPFSVNMETAECPWQPGHLLLRVGLKGKEIHRAERPPSNLVFLLDVSGSMSDANKLPLLKTSLALLVGELTENDRVSIVTYAGEAGLRLAPTRGHEKEKLMGAIDSLSAGGSTNGSAGIELAYEQAGQYFLKEGTNRVILATDGDLNVGVTSDTALVELIKSKAAAGTFLTVLGFGEGNLQDAKLEKLADNGNGQYAYIDSVREARKVLVEELSGSTVTIAKDVKIQIEFNPAQIASYRLLGYENRVLAAKDFNDDKKDAGEIGAGHSVTALYELVPVGAKEAAVVVEGEPLKYQKAAASGKRELPDDAPLTNAATSGELLTLKLRYKQPDGVESRLIEFPLKERGGKFNAASKDLQFASAVASFGMILRGSEHKGSGNLAAVAEIASGSLGEDKSGYRAEFVDLVRRAQALGAK
jgi:Ca-activated chloride channel family protein